MTEAVAPVADLASATEPKMGMSISDSPAFLGFTPATKQFLPLAYSTHFSVWNWPVLPVMPWVMTLVSLLIRIDIRLLLYLPWTALTIAVAASAMVSAEMIGRPDSARIFLPRSSLVPFMRTTSGTFRSTSRAAVTTPLAMVSQRMMPPKMLTRMPLTLGFLSMMVKAAVTFSVVAPPPTSRKLAGSPPNSLMVSMVAMARPAPLTMQPMSPSRLM